MGVGQGFLALPRGKMPKQYQRGLKESPIEISICHYLRVKGYFFWKQANAGYFNPKMKKFVKHHNPYTRTGVPDLLVVKAGQLIGLEVKSATGRQTESQLEFEADLKKAGGKYFVVRSVDDVIALGL